MRAGERDDLAVRLFDRPGALVGALGAERVEYVGDGDDTGFDRDIGAGELVGIAGAVPALVVALSDQLGGANDLGRACSRMRAPIETWVRMILSSSGVSLPGFDRIASAMPILPMSCSGAAR